MELLDVLHQYFRGEKYLGIALVPIGVVALGFAFALWRMESGGFRWGAMLPVVLFGLLGVAVGSGLAIRTDRQVAELETLHREDPRAMVAQEHARMAKVNANWTRLKIAWTAMAVIALGLIWGVQREWALGLGTTMLAFAAAVMMLDVFAERRAEVYAAALDRAARASP